MKSLLDLGDEFYFEIMANRTHISRAEYDACWAIYNFSMGLGGDYTTMAMAINDAMKVLESENLIEWAKAHVACLQKKGYAPTHPNAQAKWERILAWAA